MRRFGQKFDGWKDNRLLDETLTLASFGRTDTGSQVSSLQLRWPHAEAENHRRNPR